MQTEIRDHLKFRLPNYAVPTIFITLNKLPLNPNGKIDKPNFPFPDVVEQTKEASDEDLKRWESLTETERTIATKWAGFILGLNAKTITPQNDFFDLDGHSILAQHMLLDRRRDFGANVSINTLFENPSLAGFSALIDRLLGLTNGVNEDGAAVKKEDPSYSQSLDELFKRLPTTYRTADPATIRVSAKPTVFLTGATGFLGAYITKDILDRTSHAVRLIAHVRSAKDSKAALDRLRRSLLGYGLWQDEWSTRLSCVVGDLSKPHLGIEQHMWQTLSQEVDVGQTKWVSEQLVRAAGKRGLLGSVIRPRYIPGDSDTGVCNTDDFLIRMLKGCIQLSARPRIINTINSVSVSHVARVVVGAALNPLSGGVHVVHVTGHPRLRMNEYLSVLEFYGFDVPEVKQHALMPLYHFCVTDLPATTRALELDDRNVVKILKADAENWTGIDESAGYGISRENVGRYLRYLAEIKFVSWPSGTGRALPEVNISAMQMQAVGALGGRGGISK
ncbi:hypothetical protein G7Y89_g677 [Cudoniella acicularis]|uniref:Carrier domain-containing protein n=1 Tax=Cudoniella acicularis TaxID=354080 RepID=A0A8H4W7Q0_9HELO|nr:hypothetical protein G7Y89_g677 [Cudoniella acicularis]